ncbi:DUF2004 domain-containing protein [Chryseobacterium indologenes]|uniref:DUF2004 domain-containing protein n=1 Tax=Chryseobacterium indologenes TaxID=253 RepID=UPI0003E06F28|nr:DUF2004 domain-containing protein [Chryseobacterium indologenes]QPQ52705.1 DUF2004 domain-containing protein [Chryseobacterium indologenes]GAE65417.1 hypothetical protein CIN01S_11_00530 [Chryseobacterium indologenes NBRC 14944]SFK13229.1 hypothetical protein SAMN05421692_3478 [Chryseobacterium indologenes]SUX51422.1 Uncharacterised protein [Chryseobacterium indologenes]
MTDYTLPHFGKVALQNLEEYYDVNIDFKGNEIQLDLNFENPSIDPAKLDKVKNFLENIEKFDKQNKAYITEDYHDQDGDTVKSYLEHHLEEIDREELSALINFNDPNIEPEQQLLTKLELVRVGFYPDSEDTFAILDYSIGQDLTDYLVVINTDENGQLDYMAMES